jgi:biotin operon repressor
VGEIDEELEKLKELGIMVDRDEEGYLLADLYQTSGGSPYPVF